MKMKTGMKKKLTIALVSIMIILLTACSTEADTVSQNISKAADSFEVQRRIVFFNGITDKYLLTVEGLCSLGNSDKERELSVTCKVGTNSYKKHFLGLSDNVSYFVEQTDAVYADPFHYRVIFRPESIIPAIDLQTSK
jgi:protein involved in sex pheromone biosynthesis